MSQKLTDAYNIGSGNGLVMVLSDNKPLPEPLLTQFYDSIWRH